MNCIETKGNRDCAYNIMLPYYVRYMGNIPIQPEAKYVTVDKCLLREILDLWESGIKTSGCCCGHGDYSRAFIGVRKEYSQAMLNKGYKLFPHGDSDHFYPKTQPYYGEIKMGFNWWDEEVV